MGFFQDVVKTVDFKGPFRVKLTFVMWIITKLNEQQLI